MNMRVIVLALFACAFVSAEAARPVARWDVVPSQRVTGVFKAGVVAFHEKGVKVEFDVAGKKFVAENPKLNDRVGVWEYFVPINTEKLPDGPVAVKAKAVTLDGAEYYDLPELLLYADNKKSVGSHESVTIGPDESLKEAIAKVGDGGTVYLKKGVYTPQGLGGKDRKYWTTLTVAPGVKREEVEFVPGRPGANRLRFKGVTLACDFEGKYLSLLSGEGGATECWLDDCKLMNKKGRWAGNSNSFGNRMRGYVTGGETTEMNNGPDGELIRNHVVYKIASDVWTGSDRLVVNCSCHDVDPGKTGAHPDFHQSHCRAPDYVHDVILYNVSGYDCKCQGLFGLRLKDSAFVNVSFKCDNNMYTQYSDEMINVIFAHVTLVNQTWLWREGKKGKDGNFKPTDVRVINCNLRQMGGFADLHNGDGTAGLLVKANAFYGKDRKGGPAGLFGLDALQVEEGWKDAAAHDFALKSGSPALTHGMPLQCVPTDINGNPYPAGPRPCGAYAK